MAIDFQYVPPSGPISGIEFEKQTQMVINELGHWIGDLEKVSDKSLQQSENAQQAASRAEFEALNALTIAESAAQAADTAVLQANTASDQSLSAQEKADAAYDAATAANDSSIHSTEKLEQIKKASDQAVQISNEAQQAAQQAVISLESLAASLNNAVQYNVDSTAHNADDLYERPEKLYLTNNQCTNFPAPAPFYLDVATTSDSSAVKQVLCSFKTDDTSEPVKFSRLGKIQYDGGNISKVSWGTWSSPASPGMEMMPKGLISMWSGTEANVPAGWALCNGNNGTPNLLDRFIVAAGSAYSPGQTGGDTTHSHATSGSVNPTTITMQQMPIHAHSYEYSTTAGVSAMAASGRSVGGTSRTANAGGSQAHTHGLSLDSTGMADHTPLFYALAFIMKV